MHGRETPINDYATAWYMEYQAVAFLEYKPFR